MKNTQHYLALVYLILGCHHTLLLLHLSTAERIHVGAGYHNILEFGGRPFPQFDNSGPILRAWARACASLRPATIHVPRGRFSVHTPTVFHGIGCRSHEIVFRVDGVLVGPSDFRVMHGGGDGRNVWFSFEDVVGVSVIGGVFDGLGAALWGCKKSGRRNCPDGLASLGFSNSKNIVVSGVTSVNSQLYHIVFNGCTNAKVLGATINAPGTSPNTDGIHVQESSGVTILNTRIATGDDCVSVGPGTTGLWIENVGCGPGHGISIGSLGKDRIERGVQNVTVKTAVFTGTENGVRIKSWARPSTGFVRHVLFEHITMVNVLNPIVIDQKYCPDNRCPRGASGVEVSDVTYRDIHGSSLDPVAVKFDCSSLHPCYNVRVEDVHLTFDGRPAN